MALHLLRHSPSARVVLIEKSGVPGCGVAYGTDDPAHLLNTRVSNMSAFADDPADFLDWLRARVDPSACPFSFVSRGFYGRYLTEKMAGAQGGDRLSCLTAEALRVIPQAQGVSVHLADGSVLSADLAVLATGHSLPDADPGGALTLPWGSDPLPDRDADVLIVGTGLTMVDQVMTLLDSNHRGRIEAISRRGLLPQPHVDAAPEAIGADELPLGQPVSVLMHWLRYRVALTQAQGGDWQSVVDGLRPHVQSLWQSMDEAARARFLRHACAWWEVHRHRLPPPSAERLKSAIGEGRLSLRRASFLGAERTSRNAVLARLRPTGAGAGAEEYRLFHHVFDCRGVRRDPDRHSVPVIRNLIAEGLASLDPLRLGIVVDARARVLRPDGTALSGVFAIGPVSRSAFWEITAIPDIRVQVAGLAKSEEFSV
ncbi:FAD/NAD(P)-binding protein [Rhodovulum strictum]|uniref:FAD-dependent oxidoreductase n=2 Tax=Rhodovulum strictum TaxID=58314 RepID=A0A844B4T2_9RHOB|nr:FAD-dependent oxidoreductase [Rhodovulum strictum]